MSDTQKLLDRAREMCSPPSDYRLAKQLGVTPSRVSHWRRGKATPDNEIAWKIAKILGMEITDVIAYFEKDRAQSPQKRAFWESQLPRVLSAIAIAAALYSGASRGPLIAEAHGANITAGQVIYYAQFALMLLLTLLASLSDSRGHGGPPNAA